MNLLKIKIIISMLLCLSITELFALGSKVFINMYKDYSIEIPELWDLGNKNGCQLFKNQSNNTVIKITKAQKPFFKHINILVSEIIKNYRIKGTFLTGYLNDKELESRGFDEAYIHCFLTVDKNGNDEFIYNYLVVFKNNDMFIIYQKNIPANRNYDCDYSILDTFKLLK